jgi:hypothetical protein
MGLQFYKRCEEKPPFATNFAGRTLSQIALGGNSTLDPRL